MKRSALLSALLVFTGCASYEAAYQERVLESLPNQREVTFSDAISYPGNMLCGRYTALASNGFTTITREYIAGEDFVITLPTDNDRFIYCSDDPSQALYQQLGIGGPDVAQPVLEKIRDDMEAIDGGINRYYNVNNMMPRRLTQLVDGYGVTDNNLQDPWERPYIYVEGLSGRSTPQFDLITLGADGIEGGRGANADISHDNLQILKHVLKAAER